MTDRERPADPTRTTIDPLPTPVARPTSMDRDTPEVDEDVKALVDELGADGPAPRVDVAEAAEQEGTGTDR